MPSVPGKALLILLLLQLLLLAGISHAQGVSVRGQLSESSISIEDSVTLTIVALGVDGDIDTTELEVQFDVVGRSSSRQIENRNGRITNTRSWVLELMPKRKGVFTVPPVSVGGVESQLLTLTVTDAPTGADRLLFVEASVDKVEPWVQSQVILTLRVFQAVPILDGSLSEPEASDLITRPLGEDRRFSAEKHGRKYDVLERRFALFPQTSGPMEIEPMTLIASVPSNPNRAQGFYPETRRLTRRTEPVSLEVQARPPGGNGWWLPAKSVTIESNWAEDVSQARVDQPLTREVRLQAKGVSDAQLPTLQTPIVEGAGIYADAPERGTQASVEGLSAMQKVSWAVIPQRAGKLTLPSIQIDWFDTQTGETRSALLPEESIEILPANGSVPTTPAATDNTVALNESDAAASLQTPIEPIKPGDIDGKTGALPGIENVARATEPRFWKILAVAALLGWGITGLILYRVRRGRAIDPATVDELAESRQMASASLAEVRAACTDGSPQTLSKALLSWARSQWPVNPPRSLSEISARLDSRELRNRLRLLDAMVYRPATSESSDSMPAVPTDLADHLEAAVSKLQSAPAVVDQRRHLPDF